MTVHHHIPEELLVSYAAGSLAEAWSLLIATHLALCPACRKDSDRLDMLGAVMLDELPPEPMADDAFDRLMQVVEGGEDLYSSERRIAARADGPHILPEPLRSYVGGDLHSLSWRRLGRGAFHIPIKTGDGTATARMLKVPAGCAVPSHGHNGDELTLVLRGSFSTHQGAFFRGDVELADGTIEHMPVAGPEEDCICLAVTDAPLRFKSLGARLVQPFIGI
jgi:putative transcriptional regulator